MRSAFDDQAVAGLPQDVQDGLRSLKKRTKLLKIFLFAGLHVLAIMIIAVYAMNPEYLFQNGSRGWLLLFVAMAIFLCWYIAFEIVFSAWAYRANKNLEFMAVDGVVNTPADAMLWHLVPWATLLMTFRVLRELWRASDPAQPIGAHTRYIPTDILIKLWYGVYLVGCAILPIFVCYFVVELLTSASSIDSIVEDVSIAWRIFGEFLIVSTPIFIANTVILYKIINRLYARQAARAEKVNASAPEAQSPEHPELLRLQIGLDVAWRRKCQLMVFLTISGIVTLIELVAMVGMVWSTNEQLYFNYSVIFYLTYAFDMLSETMAIACYLFLMWSYICHRNLEAMKIDGVRYSPLKAIFWWVIPVFHVAGGAMISSEIWRGSNPELGEGADIKYGKKLWLIPLNMICLACLLLFPIVAVVLSTESKTYLTFIDLVPQMLIIISIVLFIIIVHKTTNNQMARAEMIYGPDILPRQVPTQRRPPDQSASPGIMMER